jgi:hypothetical protein
VKLKQESKLFELEFEPQQAFDNLRKLAGGALKASKADIKKIAREKRRIRSVHKSQ